MILPKWPLDKNPKALKKENQYLEFVSKIPDVNWTSLFSGCSSGV